MRSRPGTSQTPSRTSHHPTAPKPFSNATSPDGVHTSHPHPPPPFPGMSRTASTRKQGFAPGTPGEDEPMAPRTSAYSAYSRNERTNTRAYSPEPHFPSPPVAKAKPSVSPLRQTHSSAFDGSRSDRPGLGRTSSKYASTGGERTNINNAGFARSASVRNSPIDHKWEEAGPFGTARPHSHHGPHTTRHRSASPKVGSRGVHAELSSSETSSSEDEDPSPETRPKAQPRKTKLRTKAQGPYFQPFAEDDPALTGQFPNTNYTRIVDDNQYHYPAPESREGPTRRPFTDAPMQDQPEVAEDGTGAGYTYRETLQPKYAPLDPSRTWSHKFFSSSRIPLLSPSLNGLPSWAVPSSVYPQLSSRRKLGTVFEDAREQTENRSEYSVPRPWFPWKSCTC